MPFGNLAAHFADPPQPTCSATVAMGLAIGSGRAQRSIDPDFAANAVREITRQFFPDGSTQIGTRGTFLSRATGHIVRENSLVILVLDRVDPGDRAALTKGCDEFQRRVLCFARTLAGRFKQESVLVTLRGLAGPDMTSFVEQDERIARGCSAFVGARRARRTRAA